MTFFEILVMVHFISDWIFQTQHQANNKSKDWSICLDHSIIYMVFFIPVLLWKLDNIVNLFWILPLLLFSHLFLDLRKFELWVLKKIKGIHTEVSGTGFEANYIVDVTSTNNLGKKIVVCKGKRVMDKGLFWIILITIDQIFHLMVLSSISLIVGG